MSLLQRLSKAEIPVCLYFNKINHRVLLSKLFGAISRLGDGVFWYSFISSLPFIYGFQALEVSFRMLAVGFISLIIYKVLKKMTSRDRPFRVSDDILQSVAALDIYSFPSGHTMHAVGFTMVALHYYPEWSLLLLPFALLVALSRLVLGLHYPSDVLMGAGIGYSIAYLSFML